MFENMSALLAFGAIFMFWWVKSGCISALSVIQIYFQREITTSPCGKSRSLLAFSVQPKSSSYSATKSLCIVYVYMTVIYIYTLCLHIICTYNDFMIHSNKNSRNITWLPSQLSKHQISRKKSSNRLWNGLEKPGTTRKRRLERSGR